MRTAMGVLGVLLLCRPGGAAPGDEVLWQGGEADSKSVDWSINLRLGTIDRDGNFVPSVRGPLRARPQVSGPGGPIMPTNMGGGTNVYEHRTGGLVPGYMRGTTFVPEIGGQVVGLLSRTAQGKLLFGEGPGKPDRIVYNRQESIQDYYALDKDGKRAAPPKPASAPPAAGVPAGWELVSFKKAYPLAFLTGEPYMVRVIGETAEFGRLDPRGELVPDYDLPVLPGVCAPRPARVNGPPNEWRFTYTLPANGQKTEDVYEFRSGRLIRGTLYDTGNFAPQMGVTIKDFKDYKPGRDLRIYNLPGVLRPIVP